MPHPTLITNHRTKNLLQIISCCIFLLASSFAKCQTELINTSISDTTQSVMYAGVPNNIKIAGIEIDSLWTITSQGSSSVKRYKGHFSFSPDQPGWDTLTVYKGTEKLFEQTFEVNKLGKLIPQLGDISTSTATVDDILANTQFAMVIPDCIYLHRHYIQRFSLNIINASASWKWKLIPGNKLDEKQIMTIEILKPGDKLEFIVFDNCSDCKMKEYPKVTITII